MWGAGRPARLVPRKPRWRDESSFLAANGRHATVYATGLVNLERHVMIDMVGGNTAADLRRRLESADPESLRAIRVVATDLAEGFGPGCRRDWITPAGSRTRSTSCVDKVSRSVQNETLDHRGRKRDRSAASASCCSPAPNISTIAAEDRMLLGLRVGDPDDEVHRRMGGQGVGARHLPGRELT